MATSSLFPLFMKAQSGGSGTGLQLLSEGLLVEVEEMPDVEVESEVAVEVSSGEVEVDLELEIEVEVS